MKKEYTQNYLNAFQSVLESFVSNNIGLEAIDDRQEARLNHDVSVIIGFVGDIKGHADFIMEKDVAIMLSSLLAGGMEITEIDEIVKSAVGELGNMVMGSACTLFSTQGISIDITPPSIITGEDFHISSLAPTFCHDIKIEGIGKICFDITLKN